MVEFIYFTAADCVGIIRWKNKSTPFQVQYKLGNWNMKFSHLVSVPALFYYYHYFIAVSAKMVKYLTRIGWMIFLLNTNIYTTLQSFNWKYNIIKYLQHYNYSIVDHIILKYFCWFLKASQKLTVLLVLVDEQTQWSRRFAAK